MQEPLILWEDNHLLIVSKPAGMLVQGDITGDRCLKDWAEEDVARRFRKPGKAFIGLPHRLDRPTSGLVVLAKTSKALARMNAVFSGRDIQKTYWAIVEGHVDPPNGRLVHHLVRDGKTKKSFVSQRPDAQEAILRYQILEKGDRYSLVEIDLETGRHHQIRVQLQAIGHPIKGDLKYGSKRSNPDGGIHLHARRISFIHPVSQERIEVLAPLPEEALWRALAPKAS
ncbi:MAG: RluA family pseudouridine synthase [Bacteroidetes bacterium]|jgi:23S rRNA pseudouridine1911/1915/1917 synthase|nr:MAG: pseudouridine synthase [Cryomorphaceae bacterium BACL23 MAG-120924-bin60]MBL6626791.1 RluA family pseudouridine synthase [Cryomorphaceae bacterium]MDA0363166.1 RluA family pseudouridine synthase [Bacteroidota bacterium]MDP4742020.1 RluA family pseudouridine synthase [Schleiferiaceae bacterium]NCZ94090.1 RluA family pseudouridine synthase [Flavobacteriia bacterium]